MVRWVACSRVWNTAVCDAQKETDSKDGKLREWLKVNVCRDAEM